MVKWQCVSFLVEMKHWTRHFKEMILSQNRKILFLELTTRKRELKLKRIRPDLILLTINDKYLLI